MTDDTEARLRDLGIELPEPSASAANYVPALVADGFLFVSGQLPIGRTGLEFVGRLGEDLDMAAGKDAARLAAINILAQAKRALGDLDRIAQIARLNGFVRGTDSFNDPHRVLDGASDLLVAALGDRGRHSRTVLVATSLPFGAAVLIDAIIQTR